MQGRMYQPEGRWASSVWGVLLVISFYLLSGFGGISDAHAETAWSDISADVSIDTSNPLRSRRSPDATVIVEITNTSGSTILAPLRLKLSQFTPNTVSLKDASGTENGDPYLDLAPYIGTEFLAGASSGLITLTILGGGTTEFNFVPKLDKQTTVTSAPLTLAITSPESLITVGSTPIQINGEVNKPGAVLTLNGAPVTYSGNSFSAEVGLEEGHNTIVARATLGEEHTTDSISLSFDKTPPYLTVESHQDGQTVYSDTVTITGLVNDIVRGTIEAEQANVVVNNQPATISNRSYSAQGISLVEGANTINITASDQVGNSSSINITLNYEIPVGKRIELNSGQAQSAAIGGILSAPLVVKVVDDSQQPVSAAPVVFRVIQGSGAVAAGSADEGRAIVATTNAEGLASTLFRVGERVGTANHKVRAKVVGYDSEIIFDASASGNIASNIGVNSGNNQRGAISQRLPQPFVVNVTDAGSNVVEGASVHFEVTKGDGIFANGQQNYEALTDKDGYAHAQYILGTTTGIDAQRVVVSLIDSSGAKTLTAGFTATAFVPGDAGNTSISGIVLDNQDNPLPGVTLRVKGTTRQAAANSEGQFKITDAPVGPVHLIADGSTTTAAGEYPTLSFNIVTVAGVDNPLYQPIHMVRLTDTNKAYAGPEDVEISMKEFPGFKLEIAKGSVTFPSGEREGYVSVTAVNANKVPMAPPNGTQPQFVTTIQPSGAVFDPPARVTMPNVDGLKPGRQIEMYSFDHDLEEFVAIGLGTVSDDGSFVKSNPGVGIVKAGWFIAPRPTPPDGDGDAEGDNNNDDTNNNNNNENDGNNDEEPGIFDQIGDFLGDLGSCVTGGGCDLLDSAEDFVQDALENIGEAIDDFSDTVSDVVDTVVDTANGLVDGATELAEQAFDTAAEVADTVLDAAQEAADPIVMATGELHYSQTDLKIAGRGIDFELKRTYRSRLHFNGRLGYNWVFNYHQLLLVPDANNQNQDIVRSMEDGRQYTYISNGDGTYTSPGDRFDVLRKNTDGTFTVRQPSGFKVNFDSNGLMTSHVDRFGNTLGFVYDDQQRLSKVIDTLGREIVFSYRSDSGHIDTVTDFSGRSVRYFYDANRDLRAVRTPIISATPNGNDFTNGKYTFYTYSSGFDEVADPRLKKANHNLLSVMDPQGNVYIRNTYNNDPDSYEFDRITEQQFGEEDQVFKLSYEELNANATKITANLPRNRTVMIDRNGNRHEYTHNYGGLLLEDRIYTNRNVVDSDPEYFVTKHAYNEDALKVSTTNHEGDVTAFQYDSNNPLRFMQNNLLSITRTPSGRGAAQIELVESFTYEPVYNQMSSIVNRRGYLTTNIFDYQHQDNLAALATELGISEADVTTQLTNAGMSLEGGVSGQILGNIVRIDSPDATLPDGSVQQIYQQRSFNRFGQLTEEIDAEGIVTQYEYYAESDPDGDNIATVSSRTLATDTGGYLKAVVKDARLDSKRTRSGSALAIRKETKYDIVGNKIEITDGRGNSTRFIRNQLNQVVRKISSAPFEYLTDYYYDANNNLVRTSQQNISTTGPNLSGFVHTIYRYNSLNDKTAEIKIPASGVLLETKYEYDNNQNLVAILQPEGNRVERLYDERDLVVQITQGVGVAEASVRTLRYDGNRNLISETDSVDNDGDGKAESSLFTYDGYNRLIQSTDAAGNRMVYSYDGNSNRTKEQRFGASGIDGIDNEILLAETTVSFDELDRPYERNDSLLVNGLPRNVGAGLTPDDNLVTGVQWFDRNGRIVRTVDDNGNTSVTTYDGLNRPVSSADANGNATSTAYDANSNVTSISVTQKSVEGLTADKVITSTYTYDELNRKVTETNALGNVSRFRYDSRNNLVQTSDPLGNVKLYIYDGINRLLESREYLSVGGIGAGALDSSNPTNRDGIISVFYNYDGNSRLISQADDNGNTTTYQYDALNRLTSTTYADQTTVALTYDKDSNVTEKTDQNGSKFSYTYDALHRLTETAVAPAAELVGSTLWTYSYDGLSRRMSATDNNDPALDTDDSKVEYRYNSFNHLLSETNNRQKSFATYDGLGNRKTLTYASGRMLSYGYDNIYNLKNIREGENNIVEYDYASRRVLERRFANGTKLSYLNAANDSGYDGINRIVQHRHSNAAQELVAGFEYAYDKANNRRYEIDQFAQLADVYEYDSAYRLIRAAYRVPAANDDLQAITNNETINSDVATIVAPNDESYIIDGVGNWSSLQQIGGAVSNAVGYQVNEMNEYTRIGADDQSHDHNGNLRTDGERNYFYDARNRLVRVTTLGGNTIATYKYDAFDRRIEKRAGSETVRYVHFGKRVLEERNALNQLQRQYVYGNRVDEVLQLRTAANEDFYYHDNSIGSIVALTDQQGNVVERYDYNAYGETTVLESDGVTPRVTSAVGNSYGFTGRRLDAETGFYYYRARYYAPERGRFIQRDPLGYADGMGVYAYVGNNPANFVDPYGLYAKEAMGDAADWVVENSDAILDGTQAALDGLSMGLDATGVGGLVSWAPDVINAGISAARGDWVGAGLSAAAAIPFIGNAANAARLGRTANNAVDAGRAIDNAIDAGRVADNVRHTCCFVAGTKILTESGYKNIEDIKLGELVYSKDIDSGVQDWKPVTHLFSKYRLIYEVIVSDYNNEELSIETTDDHPFYVWNEGWVDAVDLRPGDLVETSEYGAVEILSVSNAGRKDTVYNIEVEDFHTYYATEFDLLVHNQCDLDVALPDFDGKKTQGVLVTKEGDVVELTSGGADPNYSNYVAAGHVEGKAALEIRNRGSEGGTVYHNNTGGTCPYCNSQVPTLLPEGSSLNVVPPANSVPKTSRHNASPTNYVGNKNQPKQR